MEKDTNVPTRDRRSQGERVENNTLLVIVPVLLRKVITYNRVATNIKQLMKRAEAIKSTNVQTRISSFLFTTIRRQEGSIIEGNLIQALSCGVDDLDQRMSKHTPEIMACTYKEGPSSTHETESVDI